MAQSIMKKNTQLKFRDFMQSPMVMKNIITTLGSETRGKKFMASLTSAVNNNPQLQKCDFGSIVNGALLGEALNLSPSAQLGQFFLVPYGDKAQFQIGYKGYIQLAMRSGQYLDLDVSEIKKGELVKCDTIHHKYEFKQIEDDEEREKTETVGYYAYFKLLNGFEKELYWSKAKVIAHAKKFSQAYKSKDGIWSKHFDAMGLKSVLRTLLRQYGVLSPEMEKAYTGDMGVINDVKDEDLDVDYIDNDFSNKQEETPVIEQKEEFSDVKAFMEQQKQPEYNKDTGEVVEQEQVDFNSL